MSRLSKAWRSTRFYRSRIAWRLPKLLVIGGQKCGTSALFQYLAQHPSFIPSEEKEVDFFHGDLRYSYGIEWYVRQWPAMAPQGAIRFEASPNYLLSPPTAERIRRWLPDVRLIAVLRDPVLRGYSAWQMYRTQLADDKEFYTRYYETRFTPEEAAQLVSRTNEELEDFSLAVEREAELLAKGRRMKMGILEFGLYGPQLSRYFAHFDREQLLILDSNELRTKRVKVLNRVLQFLGLPSWNWSHSELSDVFVGKWSEPMSQRARNFLRDYYHESNCMLGEMLAEPPLFVRQLDYRKSA